MFRDGFLFFQKKDKIRDELSEMDIKIRFREILQ